MRGMVCPVLVAGKVKEPQCMDLDCAWWDDEYGGCFIPKMSDLLQMLQDLIHEGHGALRVVDAKEVDHE